MRTSVTQASVVCVETDYILGPLPHIRRRILALKKLTGGKGGSFVAGSFQGLGLRVASFQELWRFRKSLQRFSCAKVEESLGSITG